MGVARIKCSDKFEGKNVLVIINEAFPCMIPFVRGQATGITLHLCGSLRASHIKVSWSMHERERKVAKSKKKNMGQKRCMVHMAEGSLICEEDSYTIDGGEMSCWST